MNISYKLKLQPNSMVEETKNKDVICKHFPIDSNNSFVQLQVNLTEAEYNQLLEKDANQPRVVSN